VPIFEDCLALIGGKDEYGVPTDEIIEFNVKMMKSIPTDWRLPRALSGFSSCLLKSKNKHSLNIYRGGCRTVWRIRWITIC
jgi:hypothetical protein